MDGVSVRVFMLLNTMTQKQVGEERIYLAYISILLFFIVKGNQDRNLEAGLDAAWKGAAY